MLVEDPQSGYCRRSEARDVGDDINDPRAYSSESRRRSRVMHVAKASWEACVGKDSVESRVEGVFNVDWEDEKLVVVSVPEAYPGSRS